MITVLLHLWICSLYPVFAEPTYYNSDSMIEILDSKVKALATLAVELYSQRCKLYCDTLSYHGCSTITPQDMIEQSKRYVSAGSSHVTPGRWITTYDEIGQVNLREQGAHETICAFAGLDPLFKSNAEQSPYIVRQYFSTPNGIHRQFPYQQMCQLYDNRNQPWYVAGSSGPKNLMIILDSSAYMEGSHLERAKDAIVHVVNQLSYTDWVGFVDFATKAHAYTPTLLQAKKVNLQQLTCHIYNVVSGGSRNYQVAFDEAFHVLKESMSKGKANIGCTTIVQFITDGDPDTGIGFEEDETDDLVEYINRLNNDVNASIFTYGNSSSLRAMSCLGGIYSSTYKGDDDDMRVMFSNIFSILAAGSYKPSWIWTEPQSDSLGQIVQVAYPAYDTTQTPPAFLGVAAIEVLMEVFTNYSDFTKDKLYEGSRGCSNRNPLNCQMESMRSYRQKCKVNPCAISGIETCSDFILGYLFHNESTMQVFNTKQSQEKCCSSQDILNYTLSHDNLSLKCRSVILKFGSFVFGFLLLIS